MIAIIDMGIANVGSVKNMLNRLGAKAEITSDESTLASAKAIILPGVGNFDAGIKAIKWLQKDGGIGLKNPTFVNLDKIDRSNKK